MARDLAFVFLWLEAPYVCAVRPFFLFAIIVLGGVCVLLRMEVGRVFSKQTIGRGRGCLTMGGGEGRISPSAFLAGVQGGFWRTEGMI